MPPLTPARLLIVDDHLMMRQGLRRILAEQPQLNVVGEAADTDSARHAIRELQPDLVLMDLDLPGIGGLALTREMHAALPALKIIVLTGSPESRFAHEALAAGAQGYLVKTNGGADLLDAVEIVLEGKVYLCADTTTALIRANQRAGRLGATQPVLSARETQVLALVVAGRRNKEIASEMKLGIKSVETYRSRLMKKLDSATPAELVRCAIRHGFARP